MDQNVNRLKEHSLIIGVVFNDMLTKEIYSVSCEIWYVYRNNSIIGNL